MSERTNKGGATSGQKVPKSPKSKFRAKSQQEQTAESKLRMEKRGEQLDKAKKKLAKQKPPKKSGPVKKAGRAAGATVHGYVHGKLYEVEHENVGTESAHRSELVGEAALRSTSRYVKKQIREHPAKAVQKAESRHIKATADYQYRATVEAHPEMQKGGAVSRYIQKQKMEAAIRKASAGRLQSRRPRPQRKRRSQRKSWRPGPWPLSKAASCGGVAVPCLFSAAGAHAVVYVLCGDDWQRRGGGPSARPPMPPRMPICAGPRPPTAGWRPSCKTIWTATKALTIMTNTTLSWMTLNTIPMCCCLLSAPYTKGRGRWTRDRETAANASSKSGTF